MSEPLGAGFRVLFVCTANVCRSPLAEVVLQSRLDAGSLGSVVSVRSAGLCAAADQLACATGLAIVGNDPLALAALLKHRSQPVQLDLLAWADLIVTAERAQRAHVVRMSPSTRSITFTLPEAARLIGPAVAALSPGEDEEATLRGVVSGMNRLRAQLSPPSPLDRSGWHRRRLWRRDQPAHPDDILDAHGGSPTVHEEALGRVATATAAIAEGLVRAGATAGDR